MAAVGLLIAVNPALWRGNVTERAHKKIPSSVSNWHFAPDIDEPQRILLVSGAWENSAQVVKSNRCRTVYFVAGGENGKPGLYLKHDHPDCFRNRLKARWRRKAAREYAAARRLAAAGICTAQPIGWCEAGRDTFYTCQEVQGTVSFDAAWQTVFRNIHKRRQFLSALGTFLGKLMRAGVDHPDMHAGNLLVRLNGCHAPAFFLIDPYGIKVGRRMTRHRWHRLLDWLVCLSAEITQPDAQRLLAASGVLDPVAPVNVKAAWADLIRHATRDMAKRWRGRRHRLTHHSSLCVAAADHFGKWIVRRRMPLDIARQAAAKYQRGEARFIKEDVKRRLARVEIDGTTYVVKEFCRQPIWRLRSAGRRAWLNACRLETGQVRGIRCHAYLRTADRRTLLLFEDAGDSTLAREVKERGTDAARALLAAAGRTMGRLHLRDIHHPDLKATNFIIASNGSCQLTLGDLDAVRFGVPLSMPKRAAAVQQLLASLPLPLDRASQLTVIAAYSRECLLSRGQAHQLLALVDAAQSNQ